MPVEIQFLEDGVRVRTLSVENRCIETYVLTNSPDSRICVTPIYFAEVKLLAADEP